MRLTLKTLLCYLDGILEPADAEDLGRKIKESKFATDLVHRLREVSQRARLVAPRVDSKGVGFDANTVSEYLDSSLAPEREPDFEMECLRSDAQLAEVACCHQILSLWLTKPVEADAELKQRVYRIGHLSDAEQSAAESVRHADGPAAIPPPKLETVAAAATRHAPEVPDYMKADRPPEMPDYMKAARPTRLWPVAMAVLLAFTVTLLGLRAMGPLDKAHPLYRLITGDSPNQQLAQQNKPSEPSTDAANPAATAKLDKSPDAADTPAKTDNKTDLKPDSAASKTDIAENKPPLKPAPAGGEANLVPDEKPSRTETPPPATVAGTNPPLVPGVVPPKPEAPVEPNPVDATKIPAKAPPAEVALNNPPRDTPPPVPENAAGDAAIVQVGRYTSEDQILARWTPLTPEWERLAVRAPLSSGARLIAPPASRPQVVLGGVQIALDGGTILSLLSPSADGRPRLAVESGRVLLSTVAKAGTEIELTLGKGESTRLGILTFENVDSAAGLEVRNYRSPGADPQKSPPLLVVQLFTTAGRLKWKMEGSPQFAIEKDRVANIVGRQAPLKANLSVLPDWVNGKNINEIDRRTARTLATELSVERPLLLSLKEKADDRRFEVKALAVRSLAFLDQFEPSVTMFGDKEQKTFWPLHFDALQEGLARDATTAGHIRAAFERLRPDDAKDLYRLLWGYSPEELPRPTGAAELVEFLDHDKLDVRVLAFENLRRITGVTMTYRAEDSDLVNRRSAISRWRGSLKQGKIAYKTLPAPLPELGVAIVKPVEEIKEKPAEAPPAAPPVVPTPPAPVPPAAGPALVPPTGAPAAVPAPRPFIAPLPDEPSKK